MRAVDTNVLVRLVTQDDPGPARLAAAFVAPGAWVSSLVLAEVSWVLGSVYRRRPAEIAAALSELLRNPELTLQDSAAVEAALADYRQHPEVSFADCLILELARRAGHGPLGTFDRTLGRLEGATLLRSPS